MTKNPCTYIMANRKNGTLYTGVTADLAQRADAHRSGKVEGFTRRYGCTMLVWYEMHSEMLDAIASEKRIKGGSRRKKIALIESANPDWRDLYEDLNR